MKKGGLFFWAAALSRIGGRENRKTSAVLKARSSKMERPEKEFYCEQYALSCYLHVWMHIRSLFEISGRSFYRQIVDCFPRTSELQYHLRSATNLYDFLTISRYMGLVHSTLFYRHRYYDFTSP